MPPRVKKNQVIEPVEVQVQAQAPVPEVTTPSVTAAPKKRGSKKPVCIETPTETTITDKKKKTTKKKNEVMSIEPVAVDPVVVAEPVAVEPVVDVEPVAATTAANPTPNKKRGRKPKGGKLIQQLTNDNSSIQMVPNIILHLKCSASDIPNDNLTASNDNFKPGEVVSFNAMDPKGSDLNDSYQSQINTIIAPHGHDSNKPAQNDGLIGNNAYSYLNDNGSDNEDDDDDGNHSMKDILKKLNHLKTSFHRSDVFQAIGAAPRRSCCFWDTCEFDTPPVYLPKSVSANGYVVYACFCSPECALAYLMNERIDTSVKFERCQMLNAMHGKVNVSIKPAPNPQYILNKFYGNLSIQEYRKLFKGEQIVYVVNKPLTHILPEIYEENNDFMLNNKIIPTNNYKPKKKFGVF
jgi:hypothetical protein